MVKRLCLAAVIVLLLCAAAAFSFLVANGRTLVSAELKRISGHDVVFGRLSPAFPAKLALSDVRIEGVARVPGVFIEVDPLDLLRRRLTMTSIELDSPEINVTFLETPAPSASPTPVVAGPAAVAKSESGAVVPQPPRLLPMLKTSAVVDRIRVSNGVVMVQMPSAGRTWIIEGIQAELKHFSLNHPTVKTEFNISASLAKLNVPFVGNTARASGWVNWAARDMDAHVEALDDKGKVGLSADLKAEANDCVVSGRLKLVSGQRAKTQGKRVKVAETAVLDLLESLKTDIEAQFSFHTPMDHFAGGQVNISGNIMTGLQSEEISGNIVGSLKATGEKLIANDGLPTIKPDR